MKIQLTGKDARGSGGVTAEFIKGGSHVVPLEMISETADAIAVQIEKELIQYEDHRNFWNNYQSEKSDGTGLRLSGKWMEGVRQKSDVLRPVKISGKL